MGELQNRVVPGRLVYVGPAEFARVLNSQCDAITRCRMFAAMSRINVLYMIAKAGSGHLGSSFSSIDIVTWLHLQVLEEGDIYFSSKGHDVPSLYSTLIGLGRLPFENIHRLRRAGGLPGHPDVGTEGIVFNTGSLGMGISKAKGVIFADRLRGRSRRIFVMVGDGELQEGQIWESLPSAANAGMSELTVIVDHNKLQSDTYVDATSPLLDFETRFKASGWHATRCDGHDFAAISGALDEEAEGPKVVVADTIKGRGVSFMEPTAMEGEVYQFHSGAPTAEQYEQAAQGLVTACDKLMADAGMAAMELAVTDAGGSTGPATGQNLVSAYTRALIRAAEQDEGIMALDGDLALDVGLIPFRKRFANRFIECGIAEQDMVSVAGGMASAGSLPFVHSFASFLSARPNEQIYNNATEKNKIIYVGALAGLLPGTPGHSHQAVRDIASLGAIPGLVLMQPATETEVERAVDFCVSGTQESCYLRLSSVPWDVPFETPATELRSGRGHVVREGSTSVIVTGYGPILLSEAWLALEELGDVATLIDLPFLNRLDDAWLAEVTEHAHTVIALDDHYVTGGQASLVASSVAASDRAIRVVPIGVDRIPECGQASEVLTSHSLDRTALALRFERAITASGRNQREVLG